MSDQKVYTKNVTMQVVGDSGDVRKQFIALLGESNPDQLEHWKNLPPMQLAILGLCWRYFPKLDSFPAENIDVKIKFGFGELIWLNLRLHRKDFSSLLWYMTLQVKNPSVKLRLALEFLIQIVVFPPPSYH